MVRLHVSHGSGKRALRLVQCQGTVNGLRCGSRTYDDTGDRVFCGASCAATFRRLLAQTEPAAQLGAPH